MKAIPIVIAIILIAIVAVVVIGVTGGFDRGGTPTPTPTATPAATPTPTPTPTSTATPTTTGTPTTTPTPTPTPTPLIPPIVTDISPDTFHKGETFRLTFSLENQSPLLYENVYVFCHSISNDGESWIQPMPGWSNEVTTLAPGATAEVTVDAITGIDRTLGDYTLEYHVRYTYDGLKYSSEHYYPTLSVTAANDDVTAIVSSEPETFGKGEQGQFTFLLENHSSSLYEDVYIFCYSVSNDGETWIQPTNQASDVVVLTDVATAEVTVDAETNSDQWVGEYILSYYIHFTGEGDREFETRYYVTLMVIE